MQARADRAAETGRAILEAALTLFAERWLDQITLDEVAARAGVTVQTVIRRFGTKEGLIAAAGELANTRVSEQRDEAPVGDIAGAIDNLMAHYEEVGDRVLRLLAQEERWPALRPLADAGRVGHRAWVERKFAPFFAAPGIGREPHLLPALVAATDVYVWKVLRRDQGLDRSQTAAVMRATVGALLGNRDA
jgi:AcrR family transcriptional regulator